MSAMHHDTSPDLRVVGKKLKDILEVLYFIDILDKSYYVVKILNYVNVLLGFKMIFVRSQKYINQVA